SRRPWFRSPFSFDPRRTPRTGQAASSRSQVRVIVLSLAGNIGSFPSAAFHGRAGRGSTDSDSAARHDRHDHLAVHVPRLEVAQRLARLIERVGPADDRRDFTGIDPIGKRLKVVPIRLHHEEPNLLTYERPQR